MGRSATTDVPLLRNQIAALLSIMYDTEQCHGCLRNSNNWPQHKQILDHAADLIEMPVEDRWW